MIKKSKNINSETNRSNLAPYSSTLATNRLKTNLSSASSIGSLLKNSSTSSVKSLQKLDQKVLKDQQRKISIENQQQQQQQQQQQESLQKEKTKQKLRLNIKVYCDASYDDAFYCGYVRIPLDETTMLPKDLPIGPNW